MAADRRRLAITTSAASANCLGGPNNLGHGVVVYASDPVGLVQPGVGHARKPGDPFRTWTIRRQSRQK